MGPDLAQIIATLGERRKEHGPELERMRLVRDAYNNDLVIPLPELDRSERSTVLNLVNTGLDQLGARIGGFVPDIYYPPLRYGIKQSEDRAAVRRRANLAWWQTNSMGRKLRRRARHLIGYATSPVLLRPDGKREIAKWETRSPLAAYPCPTGDPDDFTPPDAIFTFQRSYKWLQTNYPSATAMLATKTAQGQKCDPAERFDIVEYVDGDCYVLAAVGKNVNPMYGNSWGDASGGAPFVELERLPNRAGMCPAVVPGRITLDRPLGQFDGMIGMYQTLARLTALEIIAVEKGIFPETYLVSRPNETARFLAGPFDGRTGQVNIVAGGDIKDATPNPGFASTNMADRIENAARGTAGVASEFGGESPTNVRTGKRGDAVMSALVDMPVQEAQEVLAASLEAENRIAVAISKNYFGSQRKSFFLSGKEQRKGPVDYIPNRDFETDENKVTYPMAGADQNAFIIGIGQRLGAGLISAQTAQEMDPFIHDPEIERERVTKDALERSLLQAMEAQTTQGVVAASDVAEIMQLVATGTSLAEAVIKVQRLAQERQATPAPAGSPETQPGLAAPGAAGAEQPAIQPPSSGQQNLSDLLNALRRPQRESPAERVGA
jgi:hypothetical protein